MARADGEKVRELEGVLHEAAELTETEIDHAFGWNARALGGPDAEMRAHPIVPHLQPEQADRFRAELEAII